MGVKQLSSQQIDYISAIDKEGVQIFDDEHQSTIEQGQKVQMMLQKLV